MNAHAAIGHNSPPDPIDVTTAPYADAIAEAETWLDGSAVTSEAQMDSVDALLKKVRAWGTDLGKAQSVATVPLSDAHKAEVARWKPTVADALRLKTGLAALVNDFKLKLQAEKDEIRRKAWQEAEALRIAAEKAAAEVDTKNIESMRAADEAKVTSSNAAKAAQTASRDTVKGLRSQDVVEVDDYGKCINWIRINDRAALMAFCDDYARRNKTQRIDGVNVSKEKRAV